MKKKISIAAILLHALMGATAQKPDMSFDRSQLTLMVMPYTSQHEDVLSKIENDEGYKTAIAAINSVLIDMGYKNTRDFRKYKEAVYNRSTSTRDASRSEKMKSYIENAPVDVLIETEILWADPPGNPRNRQVQLFLKAVDKYTGAVYADNASIRSAQREFPGLSRAVQTALTNDGAVAFQNFLRQLDASYARILAEGRQINVKFEVKADSQLRFDSRIGGERLSDKIVDCIKLYALNGQYKIIGESPVYMDFTVQIPAVDEKGASVTPSWYLRRKVDAYLYNLGFETEYSVINTWVNFMLVKAK